MSTPQIVNPIEHEELAGWVDTMQRTFLADPTAAEARRRRSILEQEWDPQRTWGARAANGWVATLRTLPRTLTIPGEGGVCRVLEIDALTNVTVAATHRRLGLMSEMLDRSLSAARERGDALSALIAAEWPIYGRFGYAPATQSADYVLHPSRLRQPPGGDPSKLRLVTREELGACAEAIFDSARRAHAGQIDRSGEWWSRVLGTGGHQVPEGIAANLLVHDGPGGPDGFVMWKPQGEFTLIAPTATVSVAELVTSSDEAYLDIWTYLAGLDHVVEVSVALRAVDEPLRWHLHNGRALVTTASYDLLWIRVLDVPKALTARAYASAGELVLEIHDDYSTPFAQGRFLLSSDGPNAECSPTDRAADLELSARALASIYLGAFKPRELAAGSLIRECTTGSLDRAAAMFAVARAPWNATWF